MDSRYIDVRNMNRYIGLRKMPDQLVFRKYINTDILNQLEKQSLKTRQKIKLQCPVCDTLIQYNNTVRICPSCNAPAEIFQVRHFTQNADTRIVYIDVNGHTKEIFRIDLQCLSCERPIQSDEACTYACEIQTYLAFDDQDNGTYIKRWMNVPEALRTDKPEIPRRLSQTNIADSQYPQHETLQQIQEIEHEAIETQPPEDVEHDSENVKHIPIEQDVEHAPVEHNTDEDLALAFIETHLVADAQGVLSTPEIYQRYLKFTHSRNRTPLKDRQLYKHIRECFSVEHTRRRINGRLQYAFIGIHWRQTDTD